MEIPYVNNANVEVDRQKLKEERKLRNKIKKLEKRAIKQKENEEKQLALKLQPKGRQVTLITRECANKIMKSNTSHASTYTFNNQTDFPELGTKYVRNDILKSDNNLGTTNFKINEQTVKVPLADFLERSSVKIVKPKLQCAEKYLGNPLDSDMPVRKRGKHRLIVEKQHSKFKQRIISDLKRHAESDVPVDNKPYM